jgi:hypothetical protein
LSSYTATFPALTAQNDIIYNEFFNYVRQKNLPLKILLTGCITGGLAFTDSQNPFYVKIVFDGITSKNEVASSKSVEFLCQTYALMVNDGSGNYSAKPVACQYTNLPKSNKNIGVELNDLSIFTTPLTIKLLTNDNTVCPSEPKVLHAKQFTIEFWLFVDE